MMEAIQSPADIRGLSLRQTEALAAEIREALIGAVALTGGHLSSNLGAVELTLALHRALDTPTDKILFDVGHQSYTHKLITGRQSLLSTLRGDGGVSGFPKRAESEYDVFETGHASTALSAAVGMARARDLLGEDYAIAALVGDGALTGGMCYEALNDAGSRPTPLIMVLNDNEMSIAHNVGALSRYLTRLRGSGRWIGTKHAVKRGLNRVPLVGPALFGAMERIKRTLKLMLVPGEFFEALGIGYLGPIDGHDIATLERALRDARAMRRPVVVHAVTQKGRGYTPAERHPDKFHGVAPFFIDNGERRVPSAKRDMQLSSEVAEAAMLSAGERDPRVVAITAAMPQGTGLQAFSAAFPDRFFDVGIAEEHAMTMAAGLAAGGLRPVFAVYASFLQRALDQLLHDICLQALPVTLLVGHAGFVPGDGATHQGIYDLAFLRAMPNLTIWTPCDAAELTTMIDAALLLDGPCLIRYPKALPRELGEKTPIGRWRRLAQGEGVGFIGYGHSIAMIGDARDILCEKGIDSQVWHASRLDTLDREALDAMRGEALIAVVEEACVGGGLGEAVAAYYALRKGGPRVLTLGVRGTAPGEHSVASLARECGLDGPCVAAAIERMLRHGKATD